MSQSTTSKGTWYEKLVEDTYRTILNHEGIADSVKTLKIERNVKIQGRSGQWHQIDVLWSFEIAGLKYITLIECKNYKTSVSKDKILVLAGVMADIPNSNGIFVTSKGYQAGAIKMANAYGNIKLMKINPAVQTLLLDMTLCRFDIINYNFKISRFKSDSETSREEKQVRLNFSTKDKIFTNESRTENFSLQEMCDEVLPKDILKNHHKYKNYERLFINTYKGEVILYPLYEEMLKVDEISFEFRVEVSNEEREYVLQKEIDTIVEDVLGNRLNYVTADKRFIEEISERIIDNENYPDIDEYLDDDDEIEEVN